MSAPNPNAGQQPDLARYLNSMVKPSAISTLPFIDPPNRARYTSACQQCWAIIENKPKESPEFQEAFKKLQELTNTLKEQYKRFKEKGGQPGAQGSMATTRPASQGQQAVPAQAGQQAGGQPQQPQQPQQGQQRPAGAPQQSQIPPEVIRHIQTFPWANPQDKPQGTPQGDQWLKDAKQTYLKILMEVDTSKKNIAKLDALINQRRAQGHEITPEMVQAKQNADARYRQQQANMHNFRTQQASLQEKNKQAQSQSQAQPQTGGGTQAGVMKTEGGTVAPSMPSVTAGGSQPFKAAVPNQPQGVTATSQTQPQQVNAPVNPAMEAARNAANVGRTSMSPVNTGQQPQQPRPQPQSQASFPGAGQPVQAGMQQPQSATAPQRPPLNTQQPAQIGQPMSGAPHSAGGPTPVTGPPVPLTHAAAVTAAARSHSDQVNRTTPQAQPQPGAPYHQQQQLGNREHASNPKMPIPKYLPQSAVGPPAPVPMGAGRPTLAGPANGVGGMLGQTALEKHTGVHVEGDGTGILSKNKLGELVREVGGSDESLTPEVEDVLLSVADEFIDNVIIAACRLAKLRDGAELQIRDIQTVLERNYNIRVPGYSLDETRVIRKFHPTGGWQQKMNAIQAAKVMGGKTDI